MGNNNSNQNIPKEVQDAIFNQINQEQKSHKSLSKLHFNIIKMIFQNEIYKQFQVQSKCSNTKFIMKEIPKQIIKNHNIIDSLQNEISILSQVQNPFIVKLFAVFQNHQNVYFLYEFIDGYSLQYYLDNNKMFTEEETKFLISNVLIAIDQIQKCNYLHLNIEPNQIIINEKGYTKLIGFQRGIYLQNQKFKLYDLNLISNYSSPELILKQSLSFTSDFYSIGIIMHTIMTNDNQINQNLINMEQLTNLTRKIHVKKSDLPEGWSIEAADIINKLVFIQKENRIGEYGIDEIIKHAWFYNTPWEKIKNQILKSPINTNINQLNSWKNLLIQNSDSKIILIQEQQDFQQQKFMKLYYYNEQLSKLI